MVSLQSCSELILQKYEHCSREFSGNAVKCNYFTWQLLRLLLCIDLWFIQTSQHLGTPFSFFPRLVVYLLCSDYEMDLFTVGLGFTSMGSLASSWLFWKFCW